MLGLCGASWISRLLMIIFQNIVSDPFLSLFFLGLQFILLGSLTVSDTSSKQTNKKDINFEETLPKPTLTFQWQELKNSEILSPRYWENNYSSRYINKEGKINMFLEYIKRNYIFEKIKVIPTGDKQKEYSLNCPLCRKKTLCTWKNRCRKWWRPKKIIIMRVNHIDSESRRFEERTMWHLNYTELWINGENIAKMCVHVGGMYVVNAFTPFINLP